MENSIVIVLAGIVLAVNGPLGQSHYEIIVAKRNHNIFATSTVYFHLLNIYFVFSLFW